METLGTGAAVVNFLFQIGSYRTIIFDFGTDISTWTFELSLRRNKGDRVKTLTYTLGSGLSFPVYQSDQIQATFSPSDTSIEEGEYYIQLRRTDIVLPLVNGLAYFLYDAPQGTADTTTLGLTVTTQTINLSISSTGETITLSGDVTGSGTTSIVTTISPVTEVSVTAVTVLDDTAFGKLHVCTGTSSDYNLTLPTPAVANYGKVIGVKGGFIASFTKVVTLIGTVDGEADTRKVAADGYFLLMSKVGGYAVISETGSWIPFTPTQTGYSANPTIGDCKYFREGRRVSFYYYESADGTSNATTKTLTLPFNATNAFTTAPAVVTNNAVVQTTYGICQTRAASNILDIYRDQAFGVWTASAAARIRRLLITYEI